MNTDRPEGHDADHGGDEPQEPMRPRPDAEERPTDQIPQEPTEPPAPGTQDPQTQQGPYGQQDPYGQQGQYAPQDPYAQHGPYVQQSPYAQQDHYAASQPPTGHQTAHYSPYPYPPYQQGAAQPSPPTAQQKPKRRVGAGGFVAGVLVAGLLGGGVGAGALALTSDSGVDAGGGGIEINDPESATNVSAAASKASPSVVTLSVGDGTASGSGSGVVLDDQGHVLTNTHVVTLGGQSAQPEISVRSHDGAVTSAEVVGTDPISDLAVVQLEDPGELQPADLGSSGDLNVGDQAVAIGAPLGLEGTVTDGIVSTLDRTIQVASAAVDERDVDQIEPGPEQDEGQDGGPGEEDFEFYFPDMEDSPAQGSIFLNVIQTDAAINQGNSGGALVNSEGEVIGVNVAIASTGGGMGRQDAGSIGVGFAVPIDYAQRVADELIADGDVSHGLLGVTVLPAGPGGEQMETLQGFSAGALVEGVPEGAPADEAGIEAGDVITEVEGRTVEDSLSLTALIREYAAGETVEITVIRDGEQHTVEATLEGM